MDVLFPLQDAFANYLNIQGNAPVKLITYCSGHTLAGCSYPGGASGYPEGANGRPSIYEERIIAWLDRYVKRAKVDTGPRIEWQAQDGLYYGARRYPPAGHEALERVTGGDGNAGGPGYHRW